MMDAAERNREFVAGLAAQGPRLHEPKMMRIGRLAAAEQAGLSGHVAKVRLVAVAAGSGNREHTLVDAVGLVATARQRPVPVGLRPPRQSVSFTLAVFAEASVAAAGERSESLCSNASSTSLASSAVSRFLAASAPLRPACCALLRLQARRARPRDGPVAQPIDPRREPPRPRP